MKNVFDERCEPIEIQEKQIKHFLYADLLKDFSMANHLTIYTDETKTLIFNHSGRMIKSKDKKLELVQTFCYLGFSCQNTV